MPLSLFKLEKLFAMKGFASTKFFVMDNTCVYIEVMSIINTDIFLMYIPSKYKFLIEKGTTTPVYKIKYLDLDENNNIIDNYAGEVDENTVENIYQEIDVNISPSIKGHDIGSHLEENYKRYIKLKDVSKDDSKEISDVIRQLKRLKFCVQNVKYKISILYKNYLCSIKKDDSIQCYIIKKYNSKKNKKLFITVDLELFYEKMESLILNMSIIKTGIYHILDKNYVIHNKIYERLIKEKNDILSFSNSIHLKKIELEKYLKETQEMLKNINFSEKSKLEKIYEINELYKNPALKGLHNDIEKTHQLAKYNKELLDIQKTKGDVIKIIFELKIKKEDIMLNVDKIMFDNNVMVECVLRNFSELSNLYK